MNIGHKAMIAATMAVGLGLSSVAPAQSNNYKIPVTLSYAASTQRDTWNTVLVVSAAVMVVGLISEEHTLTLLGGVGLVVSLVQLNKTGFRSQFFADGIDVMKSGPISFGVSPFGQRDLTPGFGTTWKPSAYVVATFKF